MCDRVVRLAIIRPLKKSGEVEHKHCSKAIIGESLHGGIIIGRDISITGGCHSSRLAHSFP